MDHDLGVAVRSDRMRSRQLSLRLTREQRLECLAQFRRRRYAVLGRKMRDNIARLLEVLELSSESDGCHLSQEVLAAKLGIDVRTFRRWRDGAWELDLLDVADGGGREQVHYVRWDCVAKLGQTHSVTGWSATAIEGISGRAATNGETQNVHVPTANPAGGRTEAELRPRTNSVRSDRTIVRSDRTFLRADRAESALRGGERGGPISPLGLNKTPLKPFHPLEGGAGETQGGARRENRSGLGPYPITLAVLSSANELDAWFEFAMSRGWVRDVDRLRVFTAARSVYRRSRRDHNPVGVGAFVRIVKRRLWFAASESDEEWAANAIRQLDRPDDLVESRPRDG